MYKDPFTGLYHTHYRDYDPIHNRWLSEDPSGYADGLNLYASYIGMDFRDPLGLEVNMFGFEWSDFAWELGVNVVKPAVYIGEKIVGGAKVTKDVGVGLHIQAQEKISAVKSGNYKELGNLVKQDGLALLQGGANTINGVQDVGTDLLNLGLTASKYTSPVGFTGVFDYQLPKFDWSKGIAMDEVGTHEASKLIGGEAVFLGLSELKILSFLKSGVICFVEGTQVKTDNGYKNIEDIEIGDMVWSKSDKTDEEGFKPVITLFNTKPTQLVHLTYRNRESSTHSSQRTINSSDDDEDSESYTLVGTSTHPFWSVDRNKWIDMGELKDGEILLLSNGSEALVKSRVFEEAEDGSHFDTYNFEVADWHTYFVAPKGAKEDQSAVWVHNVGKLCDLGKARARYYRDELGIPVRSALKMVRNGVQPNKWMDYLSMYRTRPPGASIHAHHVVMKGKFLHWLATSKGRRAVKALEDSRAILRKHNIHPEYGVENLHFAPNTGGHTQDYAIRVYEALKRADNSGLGYDAIVDVLQEIGDNFNRVK